MKVCFRFFNVISFYFTITKIMLYPHKSTFKRFSSRKQCFCGCNCDLWLVMELNLTVTCNVIQVSEVKDLWRLMEKLAAQHFEFTSNACFLFSFM